MERFPLTPHAWMFQSAPRSEERGDPMSEELQAHLRMFQSAPRSEERGDAGGEREEVTFVVSIRAPLRRAGRYPAPAEAADGRVFQSAPRSEERGD